LHREYIDISVAVATPKGLLVPVIKNCESLNFAQIEKVLFTKIKLKLFLFLFFLGLD